MKQSHAKRFINLVRIATVVLLAFPATAARATSTGFSDLSLATYWAPVW